MRMEEHPSTTAAIHISAEPMDVWNLIIHPDVMGRHSPEFQGGDWLEGAAPGLGARFLGRNQRGDTEWETISTVTAFEPPRAFEWTVGDLDEATAVWRVELEPTPSGTHVTHKFRHGPGPSGLRSAIARYPEREEEFIAKRLAGLHEGMTQTLEGIRSQAEGG